MATIKSQLVLTDGMTAPLRNINKALNIVINSFEAMQSTSGKPIDVSGFQSAREALAQSEAGFNQLAEAQEKATKKTDAFIKRLVGVAGAIGAAFSVKKILETSDAIAQTTAKLKNMTGSLENAKVLQDQIMQSANRSRGAYQATADMVTRLGTMAKNSFADTGELVEFAELVNKQFVIAGASASEQQAATMQLTQAMASGVLRGDELNSIFEQAPTLIQTIADHLNVPIGSIRKMASEGQITADVIKAAMLGSADKINGAFNEMPYTWGQVWIMIQNAAISALQPVLQVIGAGAQWIQENWTWLEPVFIGVGAAALFMAGAYGVWKGATMAVKLAHDLLNSALLKNPWTWIIIGIGAVIGVIAAWIKAVGGIKRAWDIMVAGLVLGWNVLRHGFAIGVHFVMGLIDRLRMGWFAAGNAIAGFMGDMSVAVLDILQGMVNGAIDIINGFIGVLNAIPGVNIDVIERLTFATTAAAENEAAKQARAKDYRNFQVGLQNDAKRRELRIKELGAEVMKSADVFNQKMRPVEETKGVQSVQLDQGLEGLGTIPDDVGAIKGSTADVASAIDRTVEELKYLRDIAEQEVINRFTTAEIKIDMTGMTNNLESNMDLDGMISEFTDKLVEAVNSAAEGVHA